MDKRLLVVSLIAALATAGQEPEVTAWTNGRWFDGAAFVRTDVYTAGGKLTLTRPRNISHTVDIEGGYVTGAFGEAHNHNIPAPDSDASLRMYLERGIFSVMIQGNVPEAPAALRGRVNVEGGVDVAFSNGLFTAPGGHPSALVARNIAGGYMTARDLDGGFLHPVASGADIERAWRRDIDPQKPDFIKMVLVYSEDRAAGLPRPASGDRHGLDPSLAPEIVRRARASRLRVSAHVESAYDFQVAVDAGVDLIAHLPGFWPDPARIAEKGIDIYRIDPAVAARAGRRGVIAVTTVGEALQYVADKPELQALMMELYRYNLGVLQENGVTIAIGSDQFRSTSVEEALEIHKAGLLPPPALLRALSIDTPRAIFPLRQAHGLVEGAPADFLVLDGDPLADFTAIQRIRLRVKHGVTIGDQAPRF